MDWFDDFRRFPHRCVIYQNEGADSFGGGERVVVWEGICRKESNTSLHTFRGKDYVFKSDFRIELGAVDENGEELGAVVPGLKKGMLVDVNDLQGFFEGLVISDVYAGNLGTSVYCDTTSNYGE